MPTNETETVVAGVKSSWASKINRAEVVKILIGVVALLGYKISDADQSIILGWIMATGGVITIIFRTFFTKSLTKASSIGMITLPPAVATEHNEVKP